MDIQSAIDFALANDFLVGGVATLGLGGLAFVAKSVPRTIFGAATRTFSTRLTVTTRNNVYSDVSELLNQVSVKALMRNYMPAFYKKGLAPGYGPGWGRYEGKWMFFTREMLEGKGMEIQERIDIRFLTRDTGIIQRFLDAAEEMVDPGKIKLFSSSYGHFNGLPAKHKRRMETVHIAEATKASIVDRFEWFLANEQWYLDRGIPYKLCGLLYGPPGTGKTSLVHAIASKFDLNILHVNSLESIDSLVRCAGPKDLVVIEDIDALADELNRKPQTETETAYTDDGTEIQLRVQVPDGPPKVKIGNDAGGKPILHKLLNSLDGFTTPHGLKLLMTTNHVEKLDAALTRPGRMDISVEVAAMGLEEVVSMFYTFYPDAGDNFRDMANFRGVKSMSGASLQEIFSRQDAETATWMVINEKDDKVVKLAKS